MKVLVTGVKGQLGYDVVKELNNRNYTVVGVDIEDMDITDYSSVEGVLTKEKPDVVVHCAAWTAVDLAEDEENREKVHLVNAVGTENIAKVCKMIDCKMIYISTDYVFDGQEHVRGSLMTKEILLMFTDRQNMRVSLLLRDGLTSTLLSVFLGCLESTARIL